MTAKPKTTRSRSKAASQRTQRSGPPKAPDRPELPSGVSLDHITDDLRPLAVPIEAVTPDPRNARTHPDRNLEALAYSFREYKQRKPIVVNRRTGHIEAGNGTYQVCRSLGYQAVAAVYVDDDPAAATGYAIADNRTAELADWDDVTLAHLLDELDDFTVSDLGFDKREQEKLDELIREATATGPEPSQPDETPSDTIRTEHQCPACGHRWSSKWRDS